MFSILDLARYSRYLALIYGRSPYLFLVLLAKVDMGTLERGLFAGDLWSSARASFRTFFSL